MCLGFKLVNFLRYVKKDARISLAGTDLVVANITQEVDIIIILCMLMIIIIMIMIRTLGSTPASWTVMTMTHFLLLTPCRSLVWGLCS